METASGLASVPGLVQCSCPAAAAWYRQLQQKNPTRQVNDMHNLYRLSDVPLLSRGASCTNYTRLPVCEVIVNCNRSRVAMAMLLAVGQLLSHSWSHEQAAKGSADAMLLRKRHIIEQARAALAIRHPPSFEYIRYTPQQSSLRCMSAWHESCRTREAVSSTERTGAHLGLFKGCVAPAMRIISGVQCPPTKSGSNHSTNATCRAFVVVALSTTWKQACGWAISRQPCACSFNSLTKLQGVSHGHSASCDTEFTGINNALHILNSQP